MEKPKLPKMPRCFYRSRLHYLFGLSSPSLYLNLLLNPTPEAKEYFAKVREYNDNLILWKIENRTCTREEWAEWYKRKRHEIRARQSMEDAVRGIQKSAHICAMKLKIGIRKAVRDGQQGQIPTWNPLPGEQERCAAGGERQCVRFYLGERPKAEDGNTVR